MLCDHLTKFLLILAVCENGYFFECIREQDRLRLVPKLYFDIRMTM